MNLQFLRVNSYYELELEHKIPVISEFYIGQDLGIADQLPAKILKNITEIRTKYNRLLLKVYSNKFMNDLKFSDELFNTTKDFETLESRLKELKVKKPIDQQRLKSVTKQFQQNFKKIATFMNALADLKANRLPLSFLPEDQLIYEFENNRELIDLTENVHIPVFSSQFLELHYTRQILKLNSFTLDKKSSMFFNPTTSGLLKYSLLIPFENKKWDFDAPEFKCTKKEDLTPFYQKKERIDDLLE